VGSPAMAALLVDTDDALKVPGDDGVYNGDRRGEESPGTWSRYSSGSWNGMEMGLERRQRPCEIGRRRGARFTSR
jgi:hypothetical protein